MCGRGHVAASAADLAAAARKVTGQARVPWRQPTLRTRPALDSAAHHDQHTAAADDAAAAAGVWAPCDNIGPGGALPVLLQDAGTGGGYCLEAMTWGLVPSSTPRGATPDHFRLFNARSETCGQLPSFARLVPAQRCAVLLSGFFEWTTDWRGEKQPHFVHLGGQPLLVAALYDTWDRGTAVTHGTLTE